MDHRIALKSNTPLHLFNDRGEAIYFVIENEIGRGGSCIVYEAARITGTHDQTLYRVKEFYPYKLDISREDDNFLIPAVKDAEAFKQRQDQLRSDFSHTNQLFYSDANYASMTNQLDVFSQNGTSYILSAYSSKETLATYKPKSLKECIMLVKQVAFVLERIHQQGYLYLDTKPDNVLVVDGYIKQIQLFDFDSLLSVQDIKKASNLNYGDLRLSYSKGFAPIELQTSSIKRLGPHTDVFSVGALLFFLLFGYTPSARDCEMDAVYDFSKILYEYDKCDDRFFSTLRDFFHKTLAVYYADRYQGMQDVVEQLQKIGKYADFTIPRIFSTQIAKPKIFYGREREFDELDKLLAKTDYNCLFVTGMGGIGKSTFIREYLLRRRGEFDTVLFVNYKGSIEDTVVDDSNIEINTLRQDEEKESNTKYFARKLQKMRELVRGTSSVLVIDDFTGVVDAGLRAILGTEFKVILLSRKSPSYQSSHEMKLSAVSDPYALQRIFEENLGRPIADNELDGVEHILKHVDRHTLVLELIAKQIASSHITILLAASLTGERGFSSIAPEKVDYEKDNQPSSGTIGNIIDALFEANVLSMEKKNLLKLASLLGDDGIDINQFQKIMELTSKDDLNELIKDGWLMIYGDVISMHRVIKEVVHRWEWTQPFIAAAEQFLTYFYVEIKLEASKNNYPLKLRKRLLAKHDLLMLGEGMTEKEDYSTYQRIITLRKRAWDKQGLGGKVACERYARVIDEEAPADIEKLTSLLIQSENILKQCKRELTIRNNDVYVNLHFLTVLNTPDYKEEYILDEISDIFSYCEIDFALKDIAASLEERESGNPIAIMQLYAMAVLIHAQNGRLVEAEKLLKRAKRIADKVRQSCVYAEYYDLLAAYYDILLNGAYDTVNQDEGFLLNNMFAAVDKARRYSKRKLSTDFNHLYAKHTLAKATILMRSGRGSEKKIANLINTAKRIIEENTSPYADVRLQYYLVRAWDFAFRNNEDKTEVFVEKARELSDKILPTDLQKIEKFIIPCSNLFFELRCYRKSMTLLDEGIRLCTKHPNTDSYARIKQELCEHLMEVGFEAQEFAWCQKIIERTDFENEEVLDPKNKVTISDEVRSVIANRTIY